MSFFARLFGSKAPSGVEIHPDAIWLSRDAKFAGVSRQLETLDQEDSVAVLLIAHFADTMEVLQGVVDAYRGTTPAMAVRATELSSEIASELATGEDQVIDLVVAERHPLTSVDDQVLSEFAEHLPCRCRVTYHLGLDEPIMQRFAGESVTNMLKALGMNENEKIESSMVSRRIRAAQKKLTALATGNRKAESMEEWFQLNLPGS